MNKISLLFLLQMTMLLAYGQSPEWIGMYETSYSTSMTEDEEFIWAGSFVGITRINKISGEITYFNKANAPLPDGYICTVESDGMNNTWFGTLNGYIYRYHENTWTILDTSGTLLTGGTIKDIAVDSNRVWILGVGGLVLFDGITWTRYTSENSPLPENSISALYCKEGVLWLTTYNHLVKVENGIWTLYNLPSSYYLSQVKRIDSDNLGNIWMLHNTAVRKFDGITFTTYNSDNTNLPEVDLTDMSVAPDNKVWVSASETAAYDAPIGGILRFNGSSWTQYDTLNSGIADSDVRVIVAASDGDIWFDTEIGLIGKKNINNWEYFNASPSHLSESRIVHMLSKQDGYVYVGTRNPKISGSSLYLTNLETWTPVPFYNELVHSIALDSAGILYIKGQEGIMVTDGSTATAIPDCPFLQTSYSPFNSEYAKSLLVIGPYDFWINYCDSLSEWYDPVWGGTIYEAFYGVAHYNGSSWTKYNSSNSPLTSNPANLLADSQKNIWFSTSGGLTCIDNQGLWTIYNASNSSLPPIYINQFAIDANDNIWFSDKHFGLYKFDKINCDRFVHPTLGQYNGGGTVVTDHDGSIWQKGLSQLYLFNGTDWSEINSNNSPLPMGNLNDLTIDKYGNKWIGTGFGFLIYREGGVITSSSAMPNTELSYRAYPNPFRESFSIKFNREYTSPRLVLYNSSGSIVYENDFSSSTIITVKRNNLKPGIYYYRVHSRDGIIASGKVVAI